MEEILEKPSEYRVEDRFGRTEPEITGLITSGSTGNVPFLRQLLTVKYGLHNGLVTSSSGYGFSHLEHAEADAMFDRWSVRSVYKEKRKALEQMLAQTYLHYRRWRRRAAFLTWSAHLHPQAPEDLGEVGALLAGRRRRREGRALLRRVLRAWREWAAAARRALAARRGRRLARAAAAAARGARRAALRRWKDWLKWHKYWTLRCFGHWQLFVLMAREQRFLDEERVGEAHHRRTLLRRRAGRWARAARWRRRARCILAKLQMQLVAMAWRSWRQVIEWDKLWESRIKRKILRCWHSFLLRRKAMVGDFFIWLLMRRILNTWGNFAVRIRLLKNFFFGWRDQARRRAAARRRLRAAAAGRRAAGALAAAWAAWRAAAAAAAAPPPGPASEEPEPEEEEQDDDRSPTEEEEGEEAPPAPSPPPPLLAAAPVHRRPCRCVRCLRKYGRVGFRPARHRDTMACSESACSVNEHLKRRLAAAKDFMARQEEKCKTLETNTHWQLPAHQQVNGHLAQISGKTRLRSGASKSSTEARHRKNEQKGRGQKNVLDGPDLLFKDPRSQVLATEYILTMQQASSSSRPNSSKNTLSNKVRDPRKVATDVIMAMMVENENDNNSGNNPYDNTKMRLKPEEEEKPAAQPSNKTLDFGEKGESAAQVVINNKHETLEEEGGGLKNGGEGGRKKDKKSSIVCLVPNSLSEEEILLLEKEEYLKTELVSGDENVNEADEKEEPLPAVVVKFVSDHQDEVRSNVRVPSTRKNSDDFNTNDDGGGSGDERDGNVRSSSSCTNTAMKSGGNIHGDHATSSCTTEKDILR